MEIVEFEAAEKKRAGTLAQVFEKGDVAELAHRLVYAIRRKDHGTEKKWKHTVSELTTVIQRIEPRLPPEADEELDQYQLQHPSVELRYRSKVLYMSPGTPFHFFSEAYTLSFNCSTFLPAYQAGHPFASDLHRALAGEAPARSFLGFAFFSRAVAYLVLKEFVLAIRDARIGMRLNPHESRSLLILGKACRALGWFRLAETSYRYYLQTAESLSAKRREALQRCWEECEDADKQTSEGRYDFDSYLRELKLTSELSTPPAKCCEFVGPVQIARSTTIPKTVFGTGRGMFATTDIAEGDLLCVCKPLALDMQLPPWSKQIMGRCLSKQLAKVFESSPAARAQIMSVMTGAERVRVPPRLDVPKMEIFKPSNAKISYNMVCNFFKWEEDLAVSYFPQITSESEPKWIRTFASNISNLESLYGELLRRVVGERAYSRDVMVDGQRRTVSGLWILPAYRNHSCIPNSSETYIGETMFVRACKTIAKGEEITSAYTRVCIPIEARRVELGQRWYGGCKCPRCTWEEALLRKIPELASLSRLCYDLHRKSLTSYRGQVMTDAEYTKIGIELEYILKDLGADEERKNWVRASFFAIYQHLFGLYMKAGVTGRAKLDRFKKTAIHALASVQPAHDLILRMLVVYGSWTGHPCTYEDKVVDEAVYRTAHCMFGRQISTSAIKAFVTRVLSFARKPARHDRLSIRRSPSQNSEFRMDPDDPEYTRDVQCQPVSDKSQFKIMDKYINLHLPANRACITVQ